VSAREAVLLCEALGKRLCDAHEWEGACAGELLSVDQDYTWEHSRETRALYHNRDSKRVWAYGPTKNHALCATGSTKSRGCTGGFAECGSNTYPAGAFPECVSKFGVYDQHGNAAEHMNFPLKPEELTSRGGHGDTEMKGSWFFFGTYEAHLDDCRWRAPSWHLSKVMEINSHSNYHLGFRCCKGFATEPKPDAGSQ
jgi:formylglycine-generating enzyme required for sulfatase activity